MLIVSHCHTGAVPFGLEKDSPAGTLEHLVSVLEAAGADGAIVFAPFDRPGLGWTDELAGKYRDPNEWLLEQLQRYPNLKGFATLNPAAPGAAERLRECIAAGLVGAKVHPAVYNLDLLDPALEQFWAACDEMHLPVHLHTGVHGARLEGYRPLLVDTLAARYPNMRIIIDHMGGWAFFNEALAVVQNRSNVYAGLTQVTGRAAPYTLDDFQIRALLRSVPASRMVYGLDYPWNADNLRALREDIEWVHSLGLPCSDAAMILGGTICSLIEQVRRPSA